MMKKLPVTPDEKIKNPNWSYLYAYNLRTLRDIFVYCSMKGKIEEKQLYRDMADFRIPPPKGKWINKGVKRKERLRLEYVHASEYLGFINRQASYVEANLNEFSDEKRRIIRENKKRKFLPAKKSVEFTNIEKEAIIKIILSYERARDFLWWFLNFSKYKKSDTFGPKDFIKEARPIFILGETIPHKKGSEILKRDIDGQTWKIPTLYIRLVSFVFPSWFIDLGLIDKLIMFPEFTKGNKLWHMHYPIKMTTEQFLNLDGAKLIENLFLKKESMKSIWIPYLIYVIARQYSCPTKAIKILLEKLYKEDYEHFYLERTSLQIMKNRSKYEESYIKVDGFFRANLILKKRGV